MKTGGLRGDTPRSPRFQFYFQGRTKIRIPGTNKECKYFFGDYHRGRNIEECRLLKSNPDSLPWQSSYCQTCPVPDILRHNNCPHLTLHGRAKKGFLGFGGGVEVEGWCSEYFLEAKNPAIGCGHCHEFKGPSILDLDEAE